MYHIFQTECGEYFIISGPLKYWSVESMADLYLNQPCDTIPSYTYASLQYIIERRKQLKDTYICSVDSLEDLPKLYPDEFI